MLTLSINQSVNATNQLLLRDKKKEIFTVPGICNCFSFKDKKGIQGYSSRGAAGQVAE